MKKKIVQFITSLSDGGAESLVRNYCLGIDKGKFNICVLTIYNVTNTANYSILKKNGIEVHSIFSDHSFITRVFKKLFGRWFIPAALKKFLINENPSCVHAHLSVLHYLAPISKSLTNIKLVFTCHNIPSVMLPPDSKEFYAAKKLIKYNNLQIVALHPNMKDELDKLLDIDNTCVINNGINISRYSDTIIDKEKKKKDIGLPTDSFVVGHIGRFSKVKNHSFLLDVFSKILNVRKNAFLLLVGTGELEQEITNKIHLLKMDGRVKILSNRDDVNELYKLMDVFIFPSLFEGLPMTLIEAQASGVRCIISDTIDRQSIVKENTIPVSLENSADEWCKIALDPFIKNEVYGDISKFDLENVFKTLEVLYNEKECKSNL